MLKDFNAVRITIASPQDILNWSHGEVTKAETINYRTFRSEPGGLMAEEIFGPTKDFECYCGKYKKVRYKGIVCDRCGVEVTHKRVRRERMGHIKLAAPVCHVWFSNGVPNKLALILDIPQKQLETVVYYARYVVTGLNEEEQKTALESLKDLQKKELEDLNKQSEDKIIEFQQEIEEQREEKRKEIKDKAKLELQLERINNNEKTEIAKIKSAFKQKQDNLDKKFGDIKNLITGMRVGTTLSEEDKAMLEDYDFFFFDAGMGADAVSELLGKINIDKELEQLENTMKNSKSQLKKSKAIQRLRILKGMKRAGIKPEWLVLEVLPVIPPDLRPIIQLPGGRFATYDLNDLYRRVINRNNRLKRLINLGAPEIILRNEKRMLQEAVDSLIDNNHKPGAPALNSRQMPFKSLSDVLRGKNGRFRQNLLGKRVDYSGRAVIVAGPELRFDQCGLPKSIALELFRPFIIRDLISRGYAANPTRAKIIFEQKSEEVWDILEEVIQNRPVLLNRAPSLHRYSILAFYPMLIEGNAIRLHPMVCQGFNADFDGDQMAVHLPLSQKAIEEARTRMFAKDNMIALRDATPIVNVAKDMAMGVYFATLIKGDEKNPKNFYGNVQDLLADYEIDRIRFFEPVGLLMNGKVVVTSAGRILFNKTLPEGYEFINKPLSKKDIANITSNIFRKYGNEQAIRSLDEIKDLGFKFATLLGFSISMGEFSFGAESVLEKGLDNYNEEENALISEYLDGMITQNELTRLQKNVWMDKSDEIQEEVWQLAKSNTQSTENLLDLDASGAVPVSAWIKQISGVRGYVADMSGEVVNLPLKGNYAKGLDNFQYFVAAKQVRKSFADVGLKTSESGYLTRRLVDVCQDVITKIHDCGTTEGIKISKNDQRQLSFANRIRGRFIASELIDPKTKAVILSSGDEITYELAEEIAKNENITEIIVRSPLTCKVSHGLCQKCYGYDNGTSKIINLGEAVGVIAAQALGEPTTQLTLKSKSDARASKADVTQGFPRVQELFEARTPAALAQLSEIEGVVKIIEDKKKFIIRVTADHKQTIDYTFTEGDEVVVKDGKTVKSGELLIITKDKTEINADFSGKVKVKKSKLVLEAETALEIEKSVDSLSDIIVKDGDKVQKGDQLTFGSVDPKELAQLKGIHAAQDYIVAQVQTVYAIQGLEVDDRHLEIVARQMGRYGLLNDNGDSEEYFPGDYVDVIDIETENAKLRSQNKAEIKYDNILLGITNAAIRTESFLSAASFEQQVRVLTDAALMGKVDHLRGLKENVIIGRPVPLGEVLFEKNKEEIEEAEAKAELLTSAEQN